MPNEHSIGFRAELLLRLPLLLHACMGGISWVVESRARCEPGDCVGLELGRYLLCVWQVPDRYFTILVFQQGEGDHPGPSVDIQPM